MRELILTLAISISPLFALAESAEGVWKTEVNDDGGYLEVTIGPCESDSAKTYKSKVKLTAAGLDVEGCLAFICSGRDWTRVH